MERERVIVLNYTNSLHARQTLKEGVIGIPAKKHTQGKKILNRASSEEPLYGVLYDVPNREVYGIFTTLGEAYYTDDTHTFAEMTEDPNENWGHRIHVMANLTKKKAIDKETFISWGGKVRKGSITCIPEETWIRVKKHITD